jgi:hypothetical protein
MSDDWSVARDVGELDGGLGGGGGGGDVAGLVDIEPYTLE